MENQIQLLALAEVEDILEKKSMIYSRLLTDPALAKDMETRAARHAKRKECLVTLAIGKTPKKQNEQGMYGVNEEETDE